MMEHIYEQWLFKLTGNFNLGGGYIGLCRPRIKQKNNNLAKEPLDFKVMNLIMERSQIHKNTNFAYTNT